MKKRGSTSPLRTTGILRWSTLAILAGGLAGCDSGSYTATPKDEAMAKIQSQLDALDAEKTRLMNGEVANNFELPGVGFYHARARDFFPQPHGFAQGGKWFADGQWLDAPPENTVSASHPTPEALKKVEAALEKEQQQLASQTSSGSTTVVNNHQGPGLGSALMMYWLLAGNRGSFTPGAGFQQATTQAGRWQQGVDLQRQSVNAHAAANPGYRRMVEDSRARGVPVRAGQSVRGGFGSSGRTSIGT